MNSHFKRNQNFAKITAAAFSIMYGLVPYYLNEFGIYEVSWSYINLKYSFILSFLIMLLPTFRIKNHIFSSHLKPFSRLSIYLIFFLSLVIFFQFPWHSDRESVGASVAAVFRAFWLVVIIKNSKLNEIRRIELIVLTLVLMIVDESRTYFFVSLLILSFNSRYLYLYLIFGGVCVVALAGIRVNEGLHGFDLLIYGLVGEGYNGAKSIGQVLAISMPFDAEIKQLLLACFYPIYFPIELILSRLLHLDVLTQSSIYADLVDYQLNQKLSPVGGWYILSDFIYFGMFGMVFLYAYLLQVWFISNFLFNRYSFPFGAIIFIISIKATMFVYMKFITYIFIILFLTEVFFRLKIKFKFQTDPSQVEGE